jgi:hypothetical protein
VEVTSPFVLEAKYHSAADRDVPWWWKETRWDLREREERSLSNGGFPRSKPSTTERA